MKLSIVIPVYNEEKTVKRIINRVKEIKLGKIKKEIIVINDCSKDSTSTILKKIKGIKVYTHKKNVGKGAAIRTGFKVSTGDIITVQDADLEYDPIEYKKMLIPILSGKYKVVYGSRRIGPDIKNMYWLHYFGNQMLTWFTNILFFTKLTDMETCYKMFKREVLKGMVLRSKKFDIEPEITSKILKKGYKIKEVPIRFNPRSFNEGKKINWKDGIKAALTLVKYRFIN